VIKGLPRRDAASIVPRRADTESLLLDGRELADDDIRLVR